VVRGGALRGGRRPPPIETVRNCALVHKRSRRRDASENRCPPTGRPAEVQTFAMGGSGPVSNHEPAQHSHAETIRPGS